MQVLGKFAWLNTVYNKSKKTKQFSSPISGSKECFSEPKDLTQKVREALSKTSGNTSETKTTTTDTPNAPNKNDKEDDSESVKQRDKV